MAQANILVIDDQPEVRAVLVKMLISGGYEATSASNGDEGLRIYRSGHFDLIITDIIMPEKEGLETIMAVKRENKRVKIIAISGFVEAPYLESARLLGADRILTKPCPRQRLLDTVRELLDPGATATGPETDQPTPP
jgi:CheY-like chemotaxis protein